MANPAIPVFGWATAAPTDTTVYYEAGSVVRNPAPTVGATEGWVCTVAGRPGTWVAIGTVDGGVFQSLTAAATLTTGKKVYVISGAGNYTLYAASSIAAGSEIVIVATSGISVTAVAGAANTLTGVATALSASARFASDGGNYWFRVS